MRKTYTSDLEDLEWNLLASYFEPDPTQKRKRGRVNYRNHPREIVDAIFYRIKTGCQWRNLPKDFPNYNSVATHYYKWVKSGLWERILHTLRKINRTDQGKKAMPTYAIMDSQSVKTCYGGKKIGYDGGKKIKGRKRQISVETEGTPLTVMVEAANISDTHLGARTLFRINHRFPKLRGVSADAGYKVVSQNAAKQCGIRLDIANRINDGFSILPKRWIVERTFAWLNTFRILSKDYCAKPACSIAEILIASIRILLNKINLSRKSKI